MPQIQGTEKILSTWPRKRLGRPREYGRAMYGFSVYGEEPIILDDGSPDGIELTGVFRKNTNAGPNVFNREPYMIPKNPRTAEQQSQRAKLTAGVAAWQALTPEEQAAYDTNAAGLHMSGYNLFLREYLSSA